MDRLGKRQRSRLMSRVRSKGTGPERRLTSALAAGYGLVPSTNVRGLPGTPDLVFRRQRVAVFVHGCFWHGCPAHYREPKTNVRYWRRKLAANRARDAIAQSALVRVGWRVMVVWEHDDVGVAARRVAVVVGDP